MARGTTLVKLLDDLRAEARLSMNPAHNTQTRPVHVKLLQRIQSRLWDDFDWPHLRIQRQVQVQKGQRYYDVPAEMSLDRIEKIEVFTNGRWVPLSPGIGAEHYAAHNSDLDDQAWPPRCWSIHEDEDIEVWPISNTDGVAATLEGYLRFTGIRNLRPLVDDSDRADMDDRLLTLYGAAEILAASGGKDAGLKLEQANAIAARMRSNLTPKKRHKAFVNEDPRPSVRIRISQYRPAGT